jgi:MFS family permease
MLNVLARAHSQQDRRGLPRSVMALALWATTVAVLPPLLLGALATLVGAELGFGDTQLGLAVGTFFGVSAVAAILAGKALQHQGPNWTIQHGATITAFSCVALATSTRTWSHLLAFLALAGIGNGLTQVGVNHLLAQVVAFHRQGLAYGIKQAAIPLAALVAGLALPSVGLTVGWRWAFGVSAFLSLSIALISLAWAATPRRPSLPSDHGGRSPTGPILIIAWGAALASTTVTSLTPFLVEHLVQSGFTVQAAGLFLAAGSSLGIVVRVVAGWLGDLWKGGALLLVASLMVLGSLGCALLALPIGDAAMVSAIGLCFAGGWGWGGLLWLGIVRASPERPAWALGLVQAGVSAGGASGPIVIGFVVEAHSFSLAWSGMAVVALGGALLVLVGRHLLAHYPFV